MSIVTKKAAFKNCTDNELVAYLIQKDNDAFIELMSRYKENCINYLYRIVGDYDEAYDLSQEVFVKVFLHASSFNTNKKFSSWFFAIATNIARDSLRVTIKKNTISINDLDELNELHISESSDKVDSPEIEYDKNYRAMRVQKALQSLQPHYREVLILKELQQFSFDEVADILSIEVGTVKSRVFRGRAILKEKLKDLLIDFIDE